MSLETFTRSATADAGRRARAADRQPHTTTTSRPRAADLLRALNGRKLPGSVVPEITDSMIELSTGICSDHADALAQLTEIRDALVAAADKLGVALSGGGTHPFQDWSQRRIFDKPRFKQISELYGYLSKQFTIFGQHVHVGCPSMPTRRCVLLHGMSRYIPHLIALSASVQPVRAGHRHRVPFGAAELGVRVPAVGPRALRADLGRLRRLLRQDDEAPASSRA